MVLFPSWSPAAFGLRQLASDLVRLPRTPLFLRQGIDQMPTPPWETDIVLILHRPGNITSLLGRTPRAPNSGSCHCRPATSLLPCAFCARNPCQPRPLRDGDIEPNPGSCKGGCTPWTSLLGCDTCAAVQAKTRARRQALACPGDVEPNPGPDEGPCSAEIPHQEGLLLALLSSGASDQCGVEWPVGVIAGPSGGTPNNKPPLGLWLRCAVCDTQFYFREIAQVFAHCCWHCEDEDY